MIPINCRVTICDFRLTERHKKQFYRLNRQSLPALITTGQAGAIVIRESAILQVVG